MIPFDSNGWNFNFDLDLAWTEIMQLWNLVRGVSFSFNLPDLQLVNGHFVATDHVHTIYLLDFLCGVLVFTTLRDVLFWWAKVEDGSIDEDN